MKARIKWIEGKAFMGESGSGHAVVMDGPPDFGGRNLGVRPMEMLLMGLAAAIRGRNRNIEKRGTTANGRRIGLGSATKNKTERAGRMATPVGKS